MLKGFYLTLMIGPGAPSPAPSVVLDALTGVQVTSSKDRSGFQLTFSVGSRSPLLATMLPAGYFDPMITRVMIIVTVAGAPQVLMDGIITRQELTPSNQPGQSTLTITGDDLSVLMDVVEKPEMRYPNMTANIAVSSILGQYAALGIVPLVIPPVILDVSVDTKKIPVQRGTDLAYIRLLAARYGYVFYVEPGPAPGTNLAYWGPDVRIPVPQPALNINLDAHTNVDSLTFSLDGLQKSLYILNVLDPVNEQISIPVPVPEISMLRPPLGMRPSIPSKVQYPAGLEKLSASEAAARALGLSFASSDSITASGALDVLRYGRVLRSRQMVGVRGASLAYDGLYYVNSVTHTIQRGNYKQSFQLSRDGLVSLTPSVAA
jgi:hypothetical protein